MAPQPELIASPERENWLNKHLPYRIRILRGFDIYRAHGGRDGVFEEVLPSIFDSTLIACRWSTAFLGLRLDPFSMELVIKDRNRRSDIFSADLGGALLSPSELSVAERHLLATIWRTADRASAHPIREREALLGPEETIAQAHKAASLLIEKLKTHVYGKLGLPAPEEPRE